MFALPKELHDEGVRRYGFHGLSYEYIASVLPRLDPAAATGPHRGLPPGQRRQHVRGVRRAQRGQHDGLHRGRRAADGHALRRARSGRDPVPDGPARHGCARHRKADLQPVRAARRVRRVQRHAHAAGQRRAARQARGGPVRLPHRSRAGLAGGGAGRAGRDRLHRRHRREQRRASASACAATRPGSACSWTRRPTRRAGRASARPSSQTAAGWCPPTKN